MVKGSRAKKPQLPPNERIAELRKQIRQLELEKKKLDLDIQKLNLEIEVLGQDEEWSLFDLAGDSINSQDCTSPAFFDFRHHIYIGVEKRHGTTRILQRRPQSPFPITSTDDLPL